MGSCSITRSPVFGSILLWSTAVRKIGPGILQDGSQGLRYNTVLCCSHGASATMATRLVRCERVLICSVNDRQVQYGDKNVPSDALFTPKMDIKFLNKQFSILLI